MKRRNFPVILEGIIPTQLANVVGSPQDFRGLQNRTDHTLRIDELRFQIGRATQTDGAATRDGAFTSEVQLRIGNEPVTADFVPLQAVTWPIDFRYEMPSFTAFPTDVETTGHVIRLQKPVHLDPGEAISVQWRHAATTAQRFMLTVPCRESNPHDGKGFTPWLADWKPPARTDGTGNFIDESTEADLVNPFDDHMMIERLIGRLWWGTLASGTLLEIGRQQGGSVDEQPQLPFDAIRVKMEDHESTQIVRDATPFGVIFEFIRKSWMINANLPPKGFFRVSLESLLATQVVSGTARPIQAFVGMLGYRAVR